jgi:hypothetical protein
MKTLLRTNKYTVIILGTVGCILIFACTQPVKPSRTTSKVEIRKDRIVIHPVIKLTPVDEKKMDDVLRNYDKKLYRVSTWKNGEMIRVRGHGSLTARQKAEAAEAQRQALSIESDQSVCPNVGGCPTEQLTVNERHLLKELGELLSKY